MIIGVAQPRIDLILYAERLTLLDSCFMLCLEKMKKEKASVLREGTITHSGGFQCVGVLVMISWSAVGILGGIFFIVDYCFSHCRSSINLPFPIIAYCVPLRHYKNQNNLCTFSCIPQRSSVNHIWN